MKPLTPNTLLQNRYLIIQLIGKGGMGEVYLAVDQRLGSAVALKRTYFADDEQLNQAFEREARTLARMRHPVLPKVSDHFVEAENQYLVMEHIAGEDLAKRLENNKKPFPLSWVLYWADQLLDALHYLHSHNPAIIHRDIKPQNLKLSDENNIVLLDFGLAKNAVGRSMMNSTGSIVGFTPHYAPMEQIRGLGTNAQSDIYSLSATLYQLATNHIPADALNRADSFLNDLPDSLIPPHQLNPEIPKPISEIILTGMALNQTHRHASARVMQRLLRESYAQIQSRMAAQTLTIMPSNDALPVALEDDQFATFVEKPDSGELPSAVAANGNGSISANRTPAAIEAEKSNEIVSNEPDEDFAPPAFLAEELPEKKQSEILTDVYDPNEIDKNLRNVGAFSANGEKSGRDFSEVFSAKNENIFDEIPPIEDSAAYFTTDEEIPIEETPLIDNYQSAAVDSKMEIASDSFGASISPEVSATVTEKVENKSNNKFVFIAGGIFTLLIIILGGVVGGWYWSQNRDGKNIESEIPAAIPTIDQTVQPTVEPTTDVTAINSNTLDANSNSLTTETNGDSSNPGATVGDTTGKNPDNSGFSTTTVSRPPPTPVNPSEVPPRNGKTEKPKPPPDKPKNDETVTKPKNKPDSTLINP